MYVPSVGVHVLCCFPTLLLEQYYYLPHMAGMHDSVQHRIVRAFLLLVSQ